MKGQELQEAIWKVMEKIQEVVVPFVMEMISKPLNLMTFKATNHVEILEKITDEHLRRQFEATEKVYQANTVEFNETATECKHDFTSQIKEIKSQFEQFQEQSEKTQEQMEELKKQNKKKEDLL